MKIALKAAAADGDGRPSLIQHVEATRYRANLIAGGDIVPGNTWCYLIADAGVSSLRTPPTRQEATRPKAQW
jgi:hypothetical protein